MNEELYYRIDSDDSMSDQEKRDTYRSEQANERDYEDWCDRGGW